MMAGAKVSTRGRFTAAGYSTGMRENEPKLYIAQEPAGSFADRARDTSRIGYGAQDDWRSTPTPEPIFEAAAPAQTAARPRTHSMTFGQYLAREAKRSRKDVIACIVLSVVVLMLVALWCQQLAIGAQLQDDINRYAADTETYRQLNEGLEMSLEQATSSSRIHNLAQNDLGMLRPECAQTKTIYIQAPAPVEQDAFVLSEEPELSLLDMALGFLDIIFE